PWRTLERASAAACCRLCVCRTASRVAGPRDDGLPPVSSGFPVIHRGISGSAPWPDRHSPSSPPPSRRGPRYAGLPASPASAACDARCSRQGKSTQARSEWRGDASSSPRVRLGARGSIVAIGDAVARLDLLGHQASPASLKLVDGNVLDHLPLAGHQDVDMLQCAANALAEPCNLGIVSDITMRRRLPRPNVGLVSLMESVDLGIQVMDVLKCRGQPLGVLGFQPPREYTAEAGRAMPKRERFGTLRAAELLFDECDALARDPLVRGCQVIRPRRGKHGVQALVEVLALLESHAHPRIQLPKLGVDLRQQRLVVLFTQSDDIVEGCKAGLEAHELRPQVLEVEVVLQRGLEVVRGHQLHQVVRFRRAGLAAQADDPALVLPALLANQGLEKSSCLDAIDRCVYLFDLVAVQLKRATIRERGATI